MQPRNATWTSLLLLALVCSVRADIFTISACAITLLETGPCPY